MRLYLLRKVNLLTLYIVVLNYKAIIVPSTGIPIMVNMCFAFHEDIVTVVGADTFSNISRKKF